MTAQRQDPGIEGPTTAPRLRAVAQASLPTRHGDFRIVAFQSPDGREHVALVRGAVAGQRRVPVRVHSECLTGDAFGSLRCDCRQQLERSLSRIGRLEQGVVVYLRQEGRGIGLLNKVRAYELQDAGYDTIQANEALGFRPDERDYGAAAQILAALGVRSVRLMSNNPEKIRGLENHGIVVEGRLSLVVRPNIHNRFYLETKRTRAGHLLDRPPASGVPAPA